MVDRAAALGYETRTMPLVIREIHAAPEPGLINQEWIVVENTGPAPVHTGGLRITVQPPKQRPRDVGTIDPGTAIPPGARQRIVSGSPGRRSLGAAPEDATPNYCLFLKAGWLRPDAVVRLQRNQMELAVAAYDPSAPSGVRAG